ncbi:MAG: hypothetical protein JXA11_05820 [Phycisphaerae bacterium]|nr:hypothetical protein [Phycisphaerae bacterium]
MEEVANKRSVLLYDDVDKDVAPDWHGGKQNALFSDGSAATIIEDDLDSILYISHWRSYLEEKIKELENR